jgi:hypothetical protein
LDVYFTDNNRLIAGQLPYEVPVTRFVSSSRNLVGAVLDAFAPIADETGLPVPDPAALPSLAPAQQRMPAPSNVPQKFARYDTDLPFFAGFPFGAVVPGVNWFSADGIPILPVDDAGRTNPYPLMRVAGEGGRREARQR